MVLPWLLLAAIVAVGYFNPSLEPRFPNDLGIAPEYFGLIPREHINWLPSNAAPWRTLDKAGVFFGVLLQSAVIFAVIETRRGGRFLVGFLLVNALVLAVVGTLFKLAGAREILGAFPSPNDTFFATFTYKNHWAAYAILSVAASMGLFFHRLRRPSETANSRGSPAALLAAVAVLLLLTIPLAGSRSGSLLLIPFGGLLIWELRRAITGQLAGKRGRTVFASVLIGMAGIIAFTAYLARPALVKEWNKTKTQIEQFFVHGEKEGRIHAARETWAMSRDKPVWGWGLGAYASVSPAYRPPETRDPITGRPTSRLVDAHNDWLQFLAELGWVGFALLLIPPIKLLRAMGREGWRDPFVRWTLFGGGLILVYAAMDFPLQNPAVLVLFAVLTATALKVGMLPPEEETEKNLVS